MIRIEQAVILCGGLGTRLRPLTHEIPKSMVPIKDRPFLAHLVDHFKKQGIGRFLFCTGHLQEQIEAHFGNGSSFDVEIIYSAEEEPLGTGGALLKANRLLDDLFYVSYGDSLLPIDLAPIIELYSAQPALGVITVYDNHENIAANNVQLDADGLVLAYDKQESTADMNGVEAGISLLSKTILELAIDRKFSMEMDIFPKLINRGRLFGLLTPQRFFDIGTAEGLELGKVMIDDVG
jgi:NDP-sugar pyrophosphorylase family protein